MSSEIIMNFIMFYPLLMINQVQLKSVFKINSSVDLLSVILYIKRHEKLFNINFHLNIHCFILPVDFSFAIFIVLFYFYFHQSFQS